MNVSNRLPGRRAAPRSRLVGGVIAWGLASVLVVCSCGYAPASMVGGQHDLLLSVPTFDGYTTYPELDVYAGAYLGTRLVAHGFRTTTVGGPPEAGADPGRDLMVRGVLQRVGEIPAGLGDGYTLVELQVSVRIDVSTADGGECNTPTTEGAALMRVPHDRVSELERLAAVQAATEAAIETLMLDTILCIQQLGVVS